MKDSHLPFPFYIKKKKINCENEFKNFPKGSAFLSDQVLGSGRREISNL